MRFIFSVIIFVSLCVFSVAAQNSVNAGCRLFLLKKAANDVNIEPVMLSDNEVKAFPISNNGENITIIFSYGPGRSGDFLKLNENKLMIAQCRQGEIQIKIRPEAGNERELPPMSAAKFSQYNIRVNVTGKNIRKAFRIYEGDRIEVDRDSPVIDMFGGKISIGENDYSISIETSESKTAPPVKGESVLEYNGYLLTKALIGNGVESYFAVDFAAAQSIISKAILPSTIKLTEATSVEYSEKGKRTVEYAAGGAGGTVKGLMFAEIPSLKIGDMDLVNQHFIVIDSLPKLGGREIGGIIGLDLLRRARKVSFGYSSKPADKNTLLFSDESSFSAKDVIEIPFSIASDQLYVKGFVGDEPVSFILDTGSPDSIITNDVAQTADIRNAKKIKLPIKGLDGNPISAKKATIGRLKFAGLTASAVPVIIADLPIFQQKGLTKIGLLGNSFFKKFKRVEIDFKSQLLRLQQ